MSWFSSITCLGIWHSVEIESKSKLCRLNESMTVKNECSSRKPFSPFSRWCSSKYLIEKLMWSVCVVAAPSIRDYTLLDNRENIFKDFVVYQKMSILGFELRLSCSKQVRLGATWIAHCRTLEGEIKSWPNWREWDHMIARPSATRDQSIQCHSASMCSTVVDPSYRSVTWTAIHMSWSRGIVPVLPRFSNDSIPWAGTKVIEPRADVV